MHLLVGGNKLDRGFTVEGLTVTYLNRPTSPQIDTREQRARAFGYRQDLLPYCQFFATPRTLRVLRSALTRVVQRCHCGGDLSRCDVLAELGAAPADLSHPPAGRRPASPRRNHDA